MKIFLRINMALDDMLQTANQNYESGLEKKMNEKSSLLKIIRDAIFYIPVLAASAYAFGLQVLLSTGIPMVGYTIGAWIENKKKKIKMTWNRVKRELYTGNIMGHADYWIFSMPEKLFTAYPAIFNDTFMGMLATSLVINPLLFIPVNIAYGVFFYLRDKVGFRNTFKGLFNGKIAKYAKNTYNYVKQNLWNDTKNVFKYMFPLHFFQMNYLPKLAQKIPVVREMPVAAVRMTQSALLNNPIYRILKSTQKKESCHTHPIYSQNPAVAYA